MKHDFENGKYTVELVGGELRALRYGERWRDFTGDKLIYLMLAEIDELRTKTQAQPVAAPTPPVQQDDALIDDALSEYRHLSDTCLGEKEQQEADALLLWRLDRIRKPKDAEALEVLLADHQRSLRLLDDVREWIRGEVGSGSFGPLDTRTALLKRIDAEIGEE